MKPNNNVNHTTIQQLREFQGRYFGIIKQADPPKSLNSHKKISVQTFRRQNPVTVASLYHQLHQFLYALFFATAYFTRLLLQETHFYLATR
jgi:hypothetical protein